jgi:hypothetical protein
LVVTLESDVTGLADAFHQRVVVAVLELFRLFTFTVDVQLDTESDAHQARVPQSVQTVTAPNVDTPVSVSRYALTRHSDGHQHSAQSPSMYSGSPSVRLMTSRVGAIGQSRGVSYSPQQASMALTLE